ncbi:MAG TPA: hypothetical protein VEA99_02690 [Gemmatimonadaceae bacterium]|nr:hypothetical protein [Gemmatimonadaceae bacterium]
MPRSQAPTDAAPSARRSPWPLAIALGLALVVVANAAFIYLALSNPDPVSPSYLQERR